MGGIGVLRSRQPFNDFQAAVLQTNRQLLLQNDADVTILRNGVVYQQLHLRAGSYDLSALPLLTGSNDVQIQVRDNTGATAAAHLPELPGSHRPAARRLRVRRLSGSRQPLVRRQFAELRRPAGVHGLLSQSLPEHAGGRGWPAAGQGRPGRHRPDPVHAVARRAPAARRRAQPLRDDRGRVRGRRLVRADVQPLRPGRFADLPCRLPLSAFRRSGRSERRQRRRSDGQRPVRTGDQSQNDSHSGRYLHQRAGGQGRRVSRRPRPQLRHFEAVERPRGHRLRPLQRDRRAGRRVRRHSLDHLATELPHPGAKPATTAPSTAPRCR